MGLPQASMDRDKAMKPWVVERSEYAKEQMILANAPLVSYILKTLKMDVGDEDLFSVGIVGLVKAVNTFDFDKGYHFATYASQVIRNELLMYIRKKRIQPAISLDEPCRFDNGDEVMYADIISDGKRFEDDIESSLFMANMLNRLKGKEKEAVTMFYYYDMKQDEIAKQMSVSQSYVSRLLKSAFAKCKAC